MTFNEKYFKVKKELMSKNWNIEKLEEYFLEISAEKAKSESLKKTVEIGIIPLTIAVISFISSLYQFKSLFFSILFLIFIFIELITSFITMERCNKNIYQMDMIINLSKEILNKKK